MDGFCLGYLIGTVEGLKWGAVTTLSVLDQSSDSVDEMNQLSDAMLGFCLPPQASNGQLIDVFVKYLAENPARRHESARTLLQAAFQQAFPC